VPSLFFFHSLSHFNLSAFHPDVVFLLVFVLATFYWTKSLLCNVAEFIGMLFYSESTLQLWASRRLYRIQISQFSSLASVRTTWYSFRTLISQQHPSKRRELSVRTFLCVKKLRTAPACIRLDVSAARPDDTQCSTNYGISFQNTDMWRSLQPSGRCGFPSRRAHT